MTKLELVKEIAAATDSKQADVKEIVESTFHNIAKCILRGERVMIMGFGVFDTVSKKARMARNPRDATQPVKIPARTYPRFKYTKTFKDDIIQTFEKLNKKK